jgi:lauroyl/myristoyl acyltransferase
MLSADPAATAAVIQRTLSARMTNLPPERILERLSGERILAILQLLRSYRPGGWNPPIRLHGTEHVEAALARGRGAILWVGMTVYADLVAKMAFHRAGFEVSHLSRASHGFSDSRFGARCLNPIQTRVEDRFLRQRVSLSSLGSRAALARLEERLAENGVVSVTVHRTARRPVAAPFLDGELVLAPGAAVLAQRSSAALLPVFAWRDEAEGLTIIIEAPLEVATDGDGRVLVEAVVRDYAARLAPHVLSYPGQWTGWLHL